MELCLPGSHLLQHVNNYHFLNHQVPILALHFGILLLNGLNFIIRSSLIVITHIVNFCSQGDENNEVLDRRKANHDLILFGKLIGKQELRLKVKLKDSVSGPKVKLKLIFRASVTRTSSRWVSSL